MGKVRVTTNIIALNVFVPMYTALALWCCYDKFNISRTLLAINLRAGRNSDHCLLSALLGLCCISLHVLVVHKSLSTHGVCLGSFLGERKFQFQGSLSSAHNTITLHPVTGSRTDSMLQLFPPHNLGGICKVSRQTAWIASAILGWIFLTPHDPAYGLLKTTSL